MPILYIVHDNKLKCDVGAFVEQHISAAYTLFYNHCISAAHADFSLYSFVAFDFEDDDTFTVIDIDRSLILDSSSFTEDKPDA